MALLKTILGGLFLWSISLGPTLAQENNSCITHQTLVEQVIKTAEKQKDENPEFRITNSEDGQSLIYWHFGGKTGSFFAATFKQDGCAILTTQGEIRRFTFPKTAFNTGVFFEMEPLDVKF